MSAPGSRLLHPYGLYRVIKRKRNTNRPIERSINTPVQISSPKNVQFSLRRRVEKKYQALNPDFYLKSVNSLPTIPIRNSNDIMYLGNNHNREVIFKEKLDLIYASCSGSILVRDMNNNLISEINLFSDDKFHQYSIELNPGQFYKVNFRTPSSVINFKGFNRP